MGTAVSSKHQSWLLLLLGLFSCLCLWSLFIVKMIKMTEKLQTTSWENSPQLQFWTKKFPSDVGPFSQTQKTPHLCQCHPSSSSTPAGLLRSVPPLDLTMTDTTVSVQTL